MDQNREILFTRLKEAMNSLQSFLHTSKKLALPLRRPFTHSSKPAFVDQDALSNLKLKMEAIRVTLLKADALAMEDAQDRLWLRELRDLECWVEDVVEEIQFESMRATRLEEFKMELLRSRKGKRKRGQFSSLFSNVPSGSLSLKITKITDRYHHMAMHRDALKINDDDGTRRLHTNPPTPTSSYRKCDLHGREKDMKAVINLIISENTDNECVFSTIPIIGMAGVGKTTLAQHIFHNETVRSEFNLMIWVSLSQKVCVVEATRKIIENITRSSCTLNELELLHHELISHIEGKKFLLVLDDMWDEDPTNWSTLRVPLEHGVKGSKILVTTRSNKVCQSMPVKKYHLGCLSDDDCWLVCRQRACCNRKLELSADLTDVGKKVSAKCKGLPLAAEAVGCVLSSSLDERHWWDVLENHMWLDGEDENQILRALIVSYNFLPLPLKRCFAYCSLFPKGYLFEKRKLVQLWVAQGFIQNAGNRCFHDLVDRCFFQQSPSHYHAEGIYVMHDLYHELAQRISGCEYNRIEDWKVENINEEARHSSLVPKEHHSEVVVKLCSRSGTELRSFLVVGRTECGHDEASFCFNIHCNIFQNLYCLRALDLSNTSIADLPHSIENLIHLRYLSVENSNIRYLPESIGGLFNLLTVNLSGCYYFEELPRAIKLLDNLRHLYLPVTQNCNIWMPSGIGKLTNLQILPLFVVGSDPDSCGIEELEDMVKLREELFISGLDHVSDAKRAGLAKMGIKSGLQKVILEWSPCSYAKSDDEEACKVLEMLEPNPNLEELHIRGFPGTKLASWVSYLPEYKLVTLELKDCRNVEYLPSLGRLPRLKHLYIQSMTQLRHIGVANGDDGTSNYDDESNDDNEGNIASPSHLVDPVEGRSELADNMLIDSDPHSDFMKKGPSALFIPSPSNVKIETSNKNKQKANIAAITNGGVQRKQMELRFGTGDNGSVIAKAALDVFEECLKETGMKCGEAGEDAVQKKWRALRVAELDVLAKRMRLMIEDATAAAAS